MLTNRFFNNSGPVNDTDHLCVPPIKRLDTDKVWQLILQKKYFLICGPKQCGKTSYLLALAAQINRDNRAKCLYFNVESLRGVQEDIEECMRSVLFEISSRARDNFGDDYLEDLVTEILERRGPYQAFNEFLTQWSKRSGRPIVLLVDEIDTLQEKVLTSLLSQIRAGYDKRPSLFPQSIVFCATHDVIDKQFNIKDATLRVNSLRREDLDSMFAFRAEESKTKIERGAIDRIWRYSSGQPWIVSTIAGELFHEIAPAKGLKRISPDQVDEAIDNIIVKRGNHIEYLAAQFRDERVKKCLIPILSSASMTADVSEHDLVYVQELGLIRMDRQVEIANGLYKEIIPRLLIAPVAYLINLNEEDFLEENGALDTHKLLRSFQLFFRNHGERLVGFIDYGAAGHVLVFQALLHKLAGGKNAVQREYGIGMDRVVLTLKRTYPNRQEIVFLLKTVYAWSNDKMRAMIPEMIEEAAEFAQAPSEALPEESSGAEPREIHVVAINTNPEFDWEGKTPYMKKDTPSGTVHFWGF